MIALDFMLVSVLRMCDFKKQDFFVYFRYILQVFFLLLLCVPLVVVVGFIVCLRQVLCFDAEPSMFVVMQCSLFFFKALHCFILRFCILLWLLLFLQLF